MDQVSKTKFQNLSNHFSRKTCQVAKPGFKINFTKFQSFRKPFKYSLPPWFYIYKKKVSISKIFNIIFTYFRKIKKLSNHF